jgi:hypothetical protein
MSHMAGVIDDARVFDVRGSRDQAFSESSLSPWSCTATRTMNRRNGSDMTSRCISGYFQDLVLFVPFRAFLLKKKKKRILFGYLFKNLPNVLCVSEAEPTMFEMN